MDNENAIVNTTPTTSETPSNLVAKKDNELSPNPAGFGFTKQVVTNSLPSPGAPDTLYLVPQYNGEGHVKEYYKYRWDVYKSGYERISEPVNNVKFEDGEHATPVHENTPPTKAPEKIFNGEVVFNDDIYYKGKKLPENDEVGSIVKANPTLAGTETELTGLDIDGTKYKVPQPTDVVANPTLAGTESSLAGLQVGSTKYKVEQPTNVEANPVLAGTESELTGLQVGNTKYKVGGSSGNQKYLHHVVFYSNASYYIDFISDRATPYDLNSFKQWVIDQNTANPNIHISIVPMWTALISPSGFCLKGEAPYLYVDSESTPKTNNTTTFSCFDVDNSITRTTATEISSILVMIQASCLPL